MKITFDLDDTLIGSRSYFATEKPHKKLLSKYSPKLFL